MANKLAALLITLLTILGPVASQQQDSYCFNGWIDPKWFPALARLFCSTPNPPPTPSLAPAGSDLRDNYYSYSCPGAEGLVKEAVEEAIQQQGPGIGAGLIRLFFHDCFVRGCDASVLLTTTASGNNDTEREGPPNQNSLRGFEVIDAAKAKVEAKCPGVVSCADIVAFAARDASANISYGRINFTMPGGRRDGRESVASETVQLPGPGSTLAQLQANFAVQGLSSDDMVTLSGAHTIGRARCRFFSNRLNSSSVDPAFADDLRTECQTDDTRVNQDVQTADVLDNKYYQNVLAKKVLFDSDDALKTEAAVKENADTPWKWETKFAQAMVRMGNIIDVRSKYGGEIRNKCWTINP